MLLLQLFELLLQIGQAWRQSTIGFVGRRLLQRLDPALCSVLVGPRPVLFRIEGPLLRECLQRAMIVLQLEHAIAPHSKWRKNLTADRMAAPSSRMTGDVHRAAIGNMRLCRGAQWVVECERVAAPD